MLTAAARYTMHLLDWATVPPLLPVTLMARRVIAKLQHAYPASATAFDVGRRELERITAYPIDGQDLTHDEIFCALIDALKFAEVRRNSDECN